MQELFDRNVTFAWLLHVPLLGARLGPGVVGLVLGALLVAIGLRRLAPTAMPLEDEPPPPAHRSPRRAWALIVLGGLISAGLCLHILLANPEEWDESRRVLFYAFLRPGAFVLSVLLAGIGCGLLGRRRLGARLPFDLVDAGWIAAMAALFVGLVTPTLEDWRYSFIGDEYSF